MLRAAGGGDVLERAILLMSGESTPLLKVGVGGKPGFRPFQLSNDLLALTWHSKTKAADKTRGQQHDQYHSDRRHEQWTRAEQRSMATDATVLGCVHALAARCVFQ